MSTGIWELVMGVFDHLLTHQMINQENNLDYLMIKISASWSL